MTSVAAAQASFGAARARPALGHRLRRRSLPWLLLAPSLLLLAAFTYHLHYTVEDLPMRLIGLDTVVPGKGHGEMDAPRLGWLKARLHEQPDRPTFIFMHHPPFPTGLQHMDSINCRNAPAMAALLEGRENIERVACGHHHRSIQIRWAGTIGSVAPSVAHQVVLDLMPHDDATFTMEPPGYHLHLWQPDSGTITHTAFIGSFSGPHPFLLDPDYPAFDDRESAPATHAKN